MKRQTIKIADKAGFCFGVDRAGKIAYAAAEKPHTSKTVT